MFDKMNSRMLSFKIKREIEFFDDKNSMFMYSRNRDQYNFFSSKYF